MAESSKNLLYYGDNLDVLRRHVKDETVDLVYLDPPFNSNATYNVLFAEQNGSRAASQIRAFEDSWTWNQESESNICRACDGGWTSDRLPFGPLQRILSEGAEWVSDWGQKLYWFNKLDEYDISRVPKIQDEIELETGLGARLASGGDRGGCMDLGVGVSPTPSQPLVAADAADCTIIQAA